MNTFIAALAWLATPITAVIEGWQNRKTLTVETQQAIAQNTAENKMRLETAKVDAKIAKEMNLANTISDYDQQAQKNMASSLKDEYLILLHTLPIWGYVVPNQTFRDGLDLIWLKLAEAPDYWWIIYVGMVASTFGLRWLFDKKRVDVLLKSTKQTNLN